MPDQRGYGASDAPGGSDAYDIDHLTGDLVGLLDALEIERAVFVGHDWGGFVVWAMPTLHPTRTAGVVGVNTPYMPRSPMQPTEMLKLMVGGDPERHYITWFQERGVAVEGLGAGERTPAYVAADGEVVGVLELADPLRDGAAGLAEALGLRGVEEVLLVTGDEDEPASTAAAAAAARGIAAYRQGRSGVKSLQSYHSDIH